VPDGQAKYLQGVLGTRPGDIREVETHALLGQHEGHWLYTRGQRKGLGIAHATPLYVVRTDPATNTVYVGEKHQLQGRYVSVKQMSWLRQVSEAELAHVMVKVRYAGKPSPGEMRLEPNGDYSIVLRDPQDAITPGQIAAIYDDRFSELLGGGYIEAHLPHSPFDPATAKDLPDVRCNLG
jgi:tRNA-uridine 2-sulfurtransferase